MLAQPFSRAEVRIWALLALFLAVAGGRDDPLDRSRIADSQAALAAEIRKTGENVNLLADRLNTTHTRLRALELIVASAAVSNTGGGEAIREAIIDLHTMADLPGLPPPN